MTRKALLHTLSALAAAALVSMVANGAVAGDTMDKMMRMQHAEQALPPLNMVIVGEKLETKRPPLGLTTKKGSQRGVQQFGIMENSMNRNVLPERSSVSPNLLQYFKLAN